MSAKPLREPDLLALRCEMTLLSIRVSKAMRTLQEALDQVAAVQERITKAHIQIDAAYQKLP